MKISKLFHWLYAILMFLPILVFIPNAFYYGFNETAVAQEKTDEVATYYNSNEITSISDLTVGNIYYYTDNLVTTYRGNDVAILSINVDLFKTLFSQYQNSNITRINLNLNGTSGKPYLYLSGLAQAVFIDSTPMNFILESIIDINKVETYLINNIQYTNYKYFKEYVPFTTNMSITDSMAYAWKSTWQNDLFSWTYDSFLTQPFLFITNLFNVPATNTLLYCLSYWLNISIIWLCFDVVMYVPLLVHRWLDKGIIE